MVPNNILLEAMIQIIDKFYGKIWIQTPKCINLLLKLTRLDNNIKYGINLKFKDMQIIKYMLIHVVNF